MLSVAAGRAEREGDTRRMRVTPAQKLEWLKLRRIERYLQGKFKAWGEENTCTALY